MGAVKDDSVYLRHVKDAIADIEQYASVDRAVFVADRMRQDAVIRKLEIVGEAVKKLSDETKSRAPEIPWKQIAGMRDRLTHDYFGVDLALVWAVVEQDLPRLASAVGRLLASA
jgi:uncharacterized protein with HEPN domain